MQAKRQEEERHAHWVREEEKECRQQKAEEHARGAEDDEGPLDGAARPGCCPEGCSVRGIKGARSISKSAHMRLCKLFEMINKCSHVIIMKSVEREGVREMGY